jgi:hypothetical protein
MRCPRQPHYYISKVTCSCVGFEVLTTIVMKSDVSWDIKLCFGASCCLSFQGLKCKQSMKQVTSKTRWRPHVTLKSLMASNALHSVISQKRELFTCSPPFKRAYLIEPTSALTMVTWKYVQTCPTSVEHLTGRSGICYIKCANIVTVYCLTIILTFKCQNKGDTIVMRDHVGRPWHFSPRASNPAGVNTWQISIVRPM